MQDHQIAHQDDGRRGMWSISREDRRVAEMTYAHSGAGVITIDHTFVDPSLRGHGVARTLLDAAVSWARQHGLRIVPECSYVRAVFARDASLRDLLAVLGEADRG
jgi:hypothetical protein